MIKYKGLIFVLSFVVIIGCGGKKDSAVPGNNLPEIHEATLLPMNPIPGSEISVRILASDKDDDPLTYKVEWYINGEKVGEGMSMRFEQAKKGDKIFAQVTAFDGKEWGETKRTYEVTLGGLAPRIMGVKIRPESLFVHTPQIVVSAMAEDPDGDLLNLFVYWMINDSVIPDSSNVLDLRKIKLKKHDKITVGVIASDGEFKSEPFLYELEIANSQPLFSTRLDSVVARPESLYYKLPIIDPDGDKISFELLEAPEGVKIDRDAGIIYGSASGLNTFDVVVRATDTDGAYLDARFTMVAQ